MEDRSTRLAVLSEIAKAISTSLDSEQIFHAMLAEIDRIIPCQRAALYLFQPERDVFILQFLYEKHPDPEHLNHKERPASETPEYLLFRQKALLCQEYTGIRSGCRPGVEGPELDGNPLSALHPYPGR